MKFIFTDKSIVETSIITDVLIEENIPYKLKRFVVKDFFFDDEDEDEFMIIEEMYNIECYTDLEHFDFIKHIAYQRIKYRIQLEKFYMLKPYIRPKKVSNKSVQRVSKKNTTNTNKRNKSKRKG